VDGRTQNDGKTHRADVSAAAKRRANCAIVVGGFPVVLTNKPDEARGNIAKQLAIYNCRRIAPCSTVKACRTADIALAGDENYLRSAVERLRGTGITDFNVAIAAADAAGAERTLEFWQAN
jgi:hypothetical protein